MAQARWRVTAQAQRPGFGPANQLIDFMDITFQLEDTGDIGLISVPVNQYKPETVGPLIQARADAMLAVRQLGQG